MLNTPVGSVTLYVLRLTWCKCCWDVFIKMRNRVYIVHDLNPAELISLRVNLWFFNKSVPTEQ